MNPVPLQSSTDGLDQFPDRKRGREQHDSDRRGAGSTVKKWRRDLGRLLAVFHSPKRTFAEIGEAPSVGVVAAAMWLLFAVTLAPRVIDTANPTFGSREAEFFFLQPLVVIGWPFIASALYLFVFNLFGTEARYRVILSVSLHAMWAVFVLGMAFGLLARLVAGGAPFEIGLDERTARDLARMVNPLEIGRVLLTGLGFAVALRTTPWVSLGIVFAGWLGFHSLPLLRSLLF